MFVSILNVTFGKLSAYKERNLLLSFRVRIQSALLSAGLLVKFAVMVEPGTELGCLCKRAEFTLTVQRLFLISAESETAGKT